MATGNAELNYKRRKTDAYTAQGRRGAVRPVRKQQELREQREQREQRKNPDAAQRRKDAVRPIQEQFEQLEQRDQRDQRMNKDAAQSRKGAARPGYQPYEPPRRKESRTAKKQKNKADYHPTTPLKTLTPAEIRAICLVIIVVATVAMGIIFLAAEATMTQKEINDLQKGIARVDDDIANLKIEIEQAQNMQLIKIRALEDIGLQEPTFDQYVYVSELPEPQSDFGRYIKERAYGGARIQTVEPEEE